MISLSSHVFSPADLSNELPGSAVALAVGNGLRHIRRLRLITFFLHQSGRCDPQCNHKPQQHLSGGIDTFPKSHRGRYQCWVYPTGDIACGSFTKTVSWSAAGAGVTGVATTPTGSNRGGAATDKSSRLCSGAVPNGGGCALALDRLGARADACARFRRRGRGSGRARHVRARGWGAGACEYLRRGDVRACALRRDRLDGVSLSSPVL